MHWIFEMLWCQQRRRRRHRELTTTCCAVSDWVPLSPSISTDESSRINTMLCTIYPIKHAQGFVMLYHDDVIKWKYFPCNWPFVRGIHRSPVNSPHKGQWRRALMFSLICGWINGWVNNCEAGDLRRYRAHFDVTVMFCGGFVTSSLLCTWS